MRAQQNSSCVPAAQTQEATTANKSCGICMLASAQGSLHRLGAWHPAPWRAPNTALAIRDARSPAIPREFKSSRKVPSKQGLFGAENSFCPLEAGWKGLKICPLLESPQLCCSPESSSSCSTHHMPRKVFPVPIYPNTPLSHHMTAQGE